MATIVLWLLRIIVVLMAIRDTTREEINSADSGLYKLESPW